MLEGSETPTSNFFELAEITKEDSQLYGPKMLCASDPADLSIYGNYDSEKASNLMIVFEKCDASWSSVPCKSETEIENWMLEKYIIVMSNSKKFI